MSIELKKGARSMAVKHELSSARMPRSDGLSEQDVVTTKHLYLKCLHDGSNFRAAIVMWGNCPRPGVGDQKTVSPAEMFFRGQ
jgi:hypothetical protein